MTPGDIPHIRFIFGKIAKNYPESVSYSLRFWSNLDYFGPGLKICRVCSHTLHNTLGVHLSGWNRLICLSTANISVHSIILTIKPNAPNGTSTDRILIKYGSKHHNMTIGCIHINLEIFRHRDPLPQKLAKKRGL